MLVRESPISDMLSSYYLQDSTIAASSILKSNTPQMCKAFWVSLSRKENAMSKMLECSTLCFDSFERESRFMAILRLNNDFLVWDDHLML